MWRIVFLAIIVWLIIALVKKIMKETTFEGEAAKEDQASTTDVVKCEKCEVHVLKSEAFSVNGQYFCSKAHLPDNTDTVL